MAMYLDGRGTPMHYGEEMVPRVDADEAQRLISEGGLLIDFGDPDEWLASHLPHAKLMALETLDGERQTLPKDRTIVVGGRDDRRTSEVTVLLREWGFDARLLRGGLRAWGAAGYRLVVTDTRE